jgi:hypothetical protein
MKAQEHMANYANKKRRDLLSKKKKEKKEKRLEFCSGGMSVS